MLKTKKGKTFDANLINTTIDNLTNELAKEGFAFVNIRPLTNENKEAKSLKKKEANEAKLKEKQLEKNYD